MIITTKTDTSPITAAGVQFVPPALFRTVSVLFVEARMVEFMKGEFVAFGENGVIVGIVLGSWLLSQQMSRLVWTWPYSDFGRSMFGQEVVSVVICMCRKVNCLMCCSRQAVRFSPVSVLKHNSLWEDGY
jgi:hypothetical protein